MSNIGSVEEPSCVDENRRDDAQRNMSSGSHERKRSRGASASSTSVTDKNENTQSSSSSVVQTPAAALPLSSALLTCAIKKELKALFMTTAQTPSEPSPDKKPLTNGPHDETKASSSPTASVAAAASAAPALPQRFPKNKVGALEMYKRFPDAYDLFMQRHDCRALQRFLLEETVLPRILATRTAAKTPAQSVSPSRGGEEHEEEKEEDDARPAQAPFIRIADFGCGTGRIECMFVPHPAVKAIYAYDLEMPMLKRCLVNVAHAFQAHRLRPQDGGASATGTARGLRLLPAASSAMGPIIFPPPQPASSSAASAAETASSTLPASVVSSSPDAADLVDVCLRPCPFQLVQAGFLRGSAASLSTTPATTTAPGEVQASWAAHPSCHVCVCAWSLSFVMRLQWGESHWHAAVDTVIEEMYALLDNSQSDAALVIIETLGNLSPTPTRQNTLMQRLEEVHGFERAWMRTDYTFNSVEEAVAMTQFFFGSKISSTMAEQNLSVLMECTGVWTKWKPKQQG